MLFSFLRSGALVSHCRSCRRCSSAALFGNAQVAGRSLARVVEMEYLALNVLKVRGLAGVSSRSRKDLDLGELQ